MPSFPLKPIVDGEPPFLGTYTTAEIALANAEIAGGSMAYVVGSTMIRSEDGATLVLVGVGKLGVFVDTPAGAISKLDLASAAVGKGADLVANAVRRAQTIAELRLLPPPVRETAAAVDGYYAANDGGGGPFAWDATASDPDNGVTVFRPSTNPATGRWRRIHNGVIALKQAGLKADWNGSTGTDNRVPMAAMLADTAVKRILGSAESYYFGTIVGDTTLFTLTRDVIIDWGGAEIVCTGQNSGAFTSTTFIAFKDCRINMSNYVFNDVGFTFAGPSRGVTPVLLWADAATTRGHSIGPMRVKNGQSLLTAVSTSPLLYRSIGVKLVGACVGDNAYYGLNLANNGDQVTGDYSLDKSNRALFVYGVDGVDVSFSCATPDAASANLLISATGTGFPDTKNIRAIARFGALNGPIVLADQPSANGSGVYSNIDLTVTAESYGANLTTLVPAIRFGAYDGSSALYTVEKTVKMTNIKVVYRPAAAIGLLDDSVKVYTPSPNYGQFSINDDAQAILQSLFPRNASNVVMGPSILESNGRYVVCIGGDLTAANSVAKIPARVLASNKKNAPVGIRLRAFAANGAGISVPYTMTDYLIVGTLIGDGTFDIETPVQIATVNGNGTPCTFTIASTGGFLTVTASLYTGVFAALRVSAELF